MVTSSTCKIKAPYMVSKAGKIYSIQWHVRIKNCKWANPDKQLFSKLIDLKRQSKKVTKIAVAQLQQSRHDNVVTAEFRRQGTKPPHKQKTEITENVYYCQEIHFFVIVDSWHYHNRKCLALTREDKLFLVGKRLQLDKQYVSSKGKDTNTSLPVLDCSILRVERTAWIVVHH